MSKRILLIVLLFSSSLLSFTQKYINYKFHDIDSMLKVLPTQGKEERINTLNKIARSFCFYDKYKISQQYTEDAMTLAKKLNYKEGIAEAHRNFAILNLYKSNYSVALNNFFESLHL